MKHFFSELFGFTRFLIGDLTVIHAVIIAAVALVIGLVFGGELLGFWLCGIVLACAAVVATSKFISQKWTRYHGYKRSHQSR